jgi:nicotinamide phosphoribosyltransferase
MNTELNDVALAELYKYTAPEKRRIMKGYLNPADIGNNFNDSDIYKFGHNRMLTPKIKGLHSYLEARKGALFQETKWFGLQYILNQLQKQLTMDDAKQILELSKECGVPVTLKQIDTVMRKHDGFLPVEIKALPEGMIVPVSNALMTVNSTYLEDDTKWMTNYIETESSRVWYPTGVATLKHEIRKLQKRYLELTSDTMDIFDFQIHDFGARATTCREQTGIGGMAALAGGGLGTDTSLGMVYANAFYDAPLACGFSVYASEHCVMTKYGEAGEKDVFKELVLEFPNGILSLVCDSYSDKRFVSEYALELKPLIIARDGKTVFRPDSGDPVQTSLDIFNRLEAVFGTTINSKGYRVLNPKVGMLWGDGIDIYGMERILQAFFINKISACNIVFGMGGKLLQSFMNRDTERTAFKCSAQFQNGKWVDIQKNPLDQSKKSKAGILGVIYDETGKMVTVNINDPRYSPEKDLLVPVFRNGKILKYYTWEEVLQYNLR